MDPDDPACFCLLGYRRYLQAVQDLVGDPLHKVPLSLVEFVAIEIASSQGASVLGASVSGALNRP